MGGEGSGIGKRHCYISFGGRMLIGRDIGYGIGMLDRGIEQGGY
jgi:hypothetical protein